MTWNGIVAEVFFGGITGWNIGVILHCLLAGALVITVPEFVVIATLQVLFTVWFIKTKP